MVELCHLLQLIPSPCEIPEGLKCGHLHTAVRELEDEQDLSKNATATKQLATPVPPERILVHDTLVKALILGCSEDLSQGNRKFGLQ